MIRTQCGGSDGEAGVRNLPVLRKKQQRSDGALPKRAVQLLSLGFALVRKHELACRVGWDVNYYEPLPTAAIPGEERPRVAPTVQRGYVGTRPDDLIVGVEQSRPVTKEIVNPPTGRRTPSQVSEAHRRALERKQQAQNEGAPMRVRRLENVLPGPPTVKEVEATTSAEWEQNNSEQVSFPRRDPSLDAPTPSLASFAQEATGATGNATTQTVALPVVRGRRTTPPLARTTRRAGDADANVPWSH